MVRLDYWRFFILLIYYGDYFLSYASTDIGLYAYSYPFIYRTRASPVIQVGFKLLALVKM